MNRDSIVTPRAAAATLGLCLLGCLGPTGEVTSAPGEGVESIPSNPGGGRAGAAGRAPGSGQGGMGGPRVDQPNDPPPSMGSVDEPDCPSDPLAVVAGSARLTAPQFRNTVAALFPFPIDLGAKYPASPAGREFSTSVTASELLFNDVEGLSDLAERIAVQAVARLRELLPCAPAADEPACARAFIDRFATRAYRRPLLTDERDRLFALYEEVRRPPDALDFDLALGAVMAAVLQSPQFLYRLEIGAPTGTPGVRKLTPHEVAARLSYLYWDAPPDEALLDKARTGGLIDGAAIEAEATRLLGDPRARATVWRFFSEWLGFGERLYEGRVDRGLAADLQEEARRFVLGVALDSPEARLRDLFDNDRSVMNARLARHYGLSAPATDWSPVTLPPALAAGVLTKAQLSLAHSPVGDTSVVQRGHFIYERLLCFDLGDPPPNAQAANPVLPANATPRQRVEARMAVGTCAACHQYMDHAGLGMEDVDHLGRLRTATPERPLDAAGKLLALPPAQQDFVGTAALARTLGGSDEVAACLSRQWYRYALGRRETKREDRCHVARMSQRFAAAGHDLRALLRSLGGSDAFVYRSEP